MSEWAPYINAQDPYLTQEPLRHDVRENEIRGLTVGISVET